jgi:DNA-binding transcriptional MerR regulator
MFKIGDFSRICQVPASALRYYDDLGLMCPAQIDRFTGYRYYNLDQLPRLNRILALKDLGLSLEQIAELLDDNVSPDQIRGMLRLKQAELRQQVQDEQARLTRVEARLRKIESEGKMSDYEVVLKKIEPMRILSIRQVVPTVAQIGPLWTETYKALRAQGQNEVSPCLSIDYSETFTLKDMDMDMEVIYPVADSCPDTIELTGGRKMTARRLEGVPLAACAVHKGDYSGLGEVYASLGKWIAANGYRIVGSPREVYLRGGDGPEALTEIQFLVEKT